MRDAASLSRQSRLKKSRPPREGSLLVEIIDIGSLEPVRSRPTGAVPEPRRINKLAFSFLLLGGSPSAFGRFQNILSAFSGERSFLLYRNSGLGDSWDLGVPGVGTPENIELRILVRRSISLFSSAIVLSSSATAPCRLIVPPI